MNDSYSLPVRKARVCRVAGAIFVLSAAVLALAAATLGLFPGVRVHCGEAGCSWTTRPSLLLDDDVMARVQASPPTERTFAAYAEQPMVRTAIAGVTLIDTGPLALLLLAVGMALRRMGRGGRDALPRALTWLRRTSQAALAWAIARPLSESLMNSLLSAGTPDGAQLQISIDLLDVGVALMLGIAAFATVWALEAGLRAQRELDDFV